MKFCSGAERMRNAGGHLGENKRHWKVNKSTYDIPSIKRGSFWKFHVVVVQNNSKEMYKKRVLHVQSCFFAN